MPRFTVMSYNIHECVGTDKRRDAARIAEVIENSQADIVGLQEVHSGSDAAEESHQMEFIARKTGLRALAGPTLQRSNGTYGNVLLTSREVLDCHRLDLSVRGREPRGAIDADVEIDGEAVRVIVTHLGLRAFERRHQVQTLLAALSERRTRMVIVLSDINEWCLTSRSLRWLYARLGKTKLLRTFPSYFPLFALDRIWAQPPGSLVDLFVYDTPLARVASDHLPIIAVIDGPKAHPLA